MPTPLPPVLLRAPVVQRDTLTLTSPWVQWFEASYLRQGGQEAATNTELAGGVAGNADAISQTQDGLSQTQGDLSQTQEDLSQTQTTVAGLEAELTALQEAYLQTVEDLDALTTRVETLETTVADQETRLAALEAWKTALQAALPATVSVSTIPTLTDSPATADALRDNLTSAWEGPVNSNDTALATTVNAVRNALAA